MAVRVTKVETAPTLGLIDAALDVDAGVAQPSLPGIDVGRTDAKRHV